MKRDTPLFRREGEFWTITYQGDLVRLRDSKGLGYLATLLEYRGRTVPAVDLARARNDPADETARERARLNVTRAIRGAISRIVGVSPPIGSHLSNAVRTGAACLYAPPATVGVSQSESGASRFSS